MLIEILALASITNLFVHSEPTNKIKSLIYKILKRSEDDMVWRLINCCLCSGLYIGYFVTFSLYQAAIIAVVAELISKKLTEGSL